MAVTDDSFNGWSNYPTWAVNLWLGNDEDSYRLCARLTEVCWEEAIATESFSKKERAIILLADELKQLLHERNPLTGNANVYADLLEASLGKVNWRELALALIEVNEEQ